MAETSDRFYNALSEDARVSIVQQLLVETSPETFSYLAPIHKTSLIKEAPVDAETTPYAARIKTGEEAVRKLGVGCCWNFRG